MGSKRKKLGANVFEMAVERMITLYEEGHEIVVSFSAGKDSGICLEVCILAASATGRLPVKVVMRDEEIMFPGTFEYAERVAARPEVDFYWLVANQPIINIFNREQPYFWTFDPILEPHEWVREPPDIATYIEEKHIGAMVTPDRFPVEDGKWLMSVIGLRVQESTRRALGLHSMGNFYTKPHRPHGVRNVWPIYDWKDGDVWKAIQDNGWDYNKAYDSMSKLGVPRHHLRIAPPTMNAASIEHLGVAAQAWPWWFDKVCERLPGVRTAAMFGKRSVTPTRRMGETWEEAFHRICIDDAPDWIADRARRARDRLLGAHGKHSTQPFPEVKGCKHCSGGTSIASWKKLTYALWNGDPFSMKTDSLGLPYVEPEFFRAGAGTWGGKPNW